MNTFQEKLERILMPIGTKIANNKYLKVLQKSFIAVMPLTIAGSIALIISYFPFIDYVVPADVLNEIITFLDAMSSATLSIVALFLAGVIGYYYTHQEEHEGIFGAIVMICCFLIVTPMGWNEEGAFAFIPMTWLGGQGLLTAMIVGFGGGILYNKLMNSKMTIKLPDSVPPMVAEPFKMLVPALVTFLVFASVRYGMAFTSFGDVHTLLFNVFQTPLMALGTSLPASIAIVVFIQVLWFMGLHGQNIAGAVMTPIWNAAMIANLTAVQSGHAPEYIFTGQFFTGFIWMQFVSLIIACLISAKSEQLKAVSKLSIGSACFNISEPIVFGSPVVLNFMLFIPWVLTMAIFVLITWGFMSSGLCPYPLGADIPWTTPPLISGWLITGSPMGAIVQIVNVAVGVFIYLPFVKMYDKQLVKEESQGQIGE